MTLNVTCNCDANHCSRKALIKTENIKNKGSNFHNDCYVVRDKQQANMNDKYFDMNLSNDNINFSMDDSQSTKIRIKWILQLMIVMYAMVFNGMVYGYTSPAFPSLVEQNTGNLKEIYKLLWCLSESFLDHG